jgi:hypothetical protein
MKQAILLLFVFVTVSLAIACGGTAEKTASANKAAGSNNSPAANSVVGVDPNATPASESEPPAGNIGNAANTRRQIVDTSGPAPPPSFRPAGEDSQIAVSMRPDGKILEVRVFKSHPQLAKVESVWDGKGEKELKFVLKNGKVITKKSDRIENLQTAPTAVLVEIAGIKPPPPPAASSRTTKAPEKKPEQ